MRALTHEKETLFQQLYALKIAPVSGLAAFLRAVKEAGMPTALATSAPQMNVDFVFDKPGIRSYFQTVITDADVPAGKPDPAVVKIAAERLPAPASRCVVFDDSAKGVDAAQRADMALVGLTVSHEPEATEKADLVIDDYTQVNLDHIFSLIR
ncbi:HAD family hydrolase [Fibrella arboris]|uniref:HAD family hydrolase n=1 Tax=Fibrella arboris TaxID=3242486 RepID=UPI003521FFA5